jgi:uncharacterized protein DUF4124
MESRAVSQVQGRAAGACKWSNEIMIRFNVTIFAVILAVSFSIAHAETYTWTDEQGTIHFTEDPGRVPEKIRKTLRREETNSAPEEESTSEVPSAKAPEATLQAVPSGNDGDDGVYAGKTYDQWQKELAEREGAMTAIRKRIDEIAVLFRSPATGKDERKKLVAEHNSLSAQFKEMKAQYFEQVEIARKAGLTINIQQ